MSSRLTRRAMLAGATSVLGQAAFAGPPTAILPPPGRGDVPATPRVERLPGDQIVARAGLGGDVAYAVIDLASGEVVDSRLADRRMPPASTLKSVTALYALERLGPDFRFPTRVLVAGKVSGRRVEGDLILAGGGDPTLDTDRLAALAISLREAGVTEVTGRFLVWGAALPTARMIDMDQPDHVGYNPAFGGLNLNFNRVHFEWKRAGDDYAITMQARALKNRPATGVARMAIEDRAAPVFAYREAAGGSGDRWSVARRALGQDGARWLPVRFPAHYCADVFRTLARSNGIVLDRPEKIDTLPEAEEIARVSSDPLGEILAGMMKYSTNLTAEAVGLTASLSEGVPVSDLLASGSRMAGWATTRIGADNLRFRDHSGLGYGSEIGAGDLAAILAGNQAARRLMSKVTVPNPLNRKLPMSGAACVAKTGTLNFVSSLAGYLTTPSGRDLAFAILTADVERRNAIPPEARERPPGARSWASRSRGLQKSLLTHWAALG